MSMNHVNFDFTSSIIFNSGGVYSKHKLGILLYSPALSSSDCVVGRSSQLYLVVFYQAERVNLHITKSI